MSRMYRIMVEQNGVRLFTGYSYKDAQVAYMRLRSVAMTVAANNGHDVNRTTAGKHQAIIVHKRRGDVLLSIEETNR